MIDEAHCAACGSDLQSTSKFCAQCGQPVAPSQPEQPGLGDVPASDQDNARAIAGPLGNLGHRGKLIAAAGIAAAVIAAALVIVISAGNSNASAAHDDHVAIRQPAGPPPEQRCVDLWNSEANTVGHQLVGPQVRFGDVYVAVGFAADYPDKCLVTAAFPRTNGSMQFIEAGGPRTSEPYTMMQSGSANNLPASAKDWNATITEDGQLTLS
jgi:hypothetical protein